MPIDLLGVFEIARLGKVGPSAVANWRRRKLGFPRPIAVLKSGPVFQRREVEQWLKRRSADMVSSSTGKAVQKTKLSEAIEFAENPEPRCPFVVLLDTSGSMQGEKIARLNEGLKALKDELSKDELASRRVEVALVTFDSEVRVVQDFVRADQFEPPTLTAQGMTHMGNGIHQALRLVEERKRVYRTNGVQYYRPWVFMITDGEPQGETNNVVDAAAKAVADAEDKKRVAFFAVGVDGANMRRLETLVVRTPVKLRGLNFVELFIWLSASAQVVSNSQTDAMIKLPPAGWGAVEPS